jgi:hypothetical protein
VGLMNIIFGLMSLFVAVMTAFVASLLVADLCTEEFRWFEVLFAGFFIVLFVLATLYMLAFGVWLIFVF